MELSSNFSRLKNEKNPLLKSFLYFEKWNVLAASFKSFLYHFRSDLKGLKIKNFLYLSQT